MDEPSLGLTPKLVAKARGADLQNSTEPGTTVLLIEQGVREILKIVTTVYALQIGEIVFSGTLDEGQERETMRKIFLV